MSGSCGYIDWRVVRARYALFDGIGAVDFAMYAEIFEVEEEEAIEIFSIAAVSMGYLPLMIQPNPQRH
jgi:multidrug transporter EmrE-like cation transporter